MWWLFSFPWTILETGLDFIARAFLLLLALLPPNVLFTTLQFFERCGSLMARLCASLLALVIRGFKSCFGGRGGGEQMPPRRGNVSQEMAAEAAAGLLLREEREAAARRTATALRRAAKKSGAKPSPSLPEAAATAKPPPATRGRSAASARPLAGRSVPVARTRTADETAAHASVSRRQAATPAATPPPPASARVSPAVVRGPLGGGTPAPESPAVPAAARVPVTAPPHVDPNKKTSSPPPETPETPPQPIPAAVLGVPLPPASSRPLPGFQSLAALSAAEEDEGLPPPLPPPRAPANVAPARAGPPAGVDLPPSFVCPITHELMEDPVVTADGQTYERHAILAWFQAHCTSPLTGDRLEHTRLTPNVMARSLIREWVERNGIEPQPRGRDHRRY